MSDHLRIIKTKDSNTDRTIEIHILPSAAAFAKIWVGERCIATFDIYPQLKAQLIAALDACQTLPLEEATECQRRGIPHIPRVTEDRIIARLERHQLDVTKEPVYSLWQNGRVIGQMALSTARNIYGDRLDIVKAGAPSNDAALGSQDFREVVNVDDDHGDNFEDDRRGAAHLHEMHNDDYDGTLDYNEGVARKKP